MRSHEEWWKAIDRLAGRNGLSTSALARRAGLDATSFNPSKRHSGDGRPRWPSTESISKVLDATGCTLDQMIGLSRGEASPEQAAGIPVATLEQLLNREFFDAAGPRHGADLARLSLPGPVGDPGLYALQVGDEAQLRPRYAPGDILLLSSNASAAPGHRILAVLYSDGIIAGTLGRMHVKSVEVTPFAEGAAPVRYAREAIRQMSRILWASQ